jgi:hypothetical protein
VNIELHVDRLVLDGFSLSPGERDAIRASLENELTRLLEKGTLSPELLSGRALPTLAAPTLETLAGLPAPALGAGIAQAIYRALSAGETPCAPQ